MDGKDDTLSLLLRFGFCKVKTFLECWLAAESAGLDDCAVGLLVEMRIHFGDFRIQIGGMGAADCVPRRLCVLLCLLFLTGHLTLAADAVGDVRRDATVRAVESIMPSVVNISTETLVQVNDPLQNMFRDFFGKQWGRNTKQSLGSGVIIDEDGYILTNLHVVRRATRITVTLADGRVFEAQALVGTTKTDVALLKLVAGEKEKFQAVRFAAADDLLLGETVLALGNPFGLGGSVARGILSSKARRPPLDDSSSLAVEDWLQTDAAINPGNSGGPLVNLRGELIGLNVAVVLEAQGIGFAIPIRRVLEALDELFTPERVQGLWFGARFEVRDGGLIVLEVQPESPAELADLEPGDSVTGINDVTPGNILQFNRELIAAGQRSEVRVKVRRKGVDRTLTVRLIPESAFFNDSLIRSKLGASLGPVTPQFAARLGNQTVSGLVVTGVEPGGAADTAGLAEGQVVRGVDGQAVTSVLEAARLLNLKKSGDRVRLSLIVPRTRGVFLQLLAIDRDVVVQ